MAFESLTDRLNGVFKKLRGKGKLTEADIKAAMREVRMALLEADVNYKVAKDFCAQVSERAMGQEVMESLTPAQQVVKIVNDELTKLMGGDELHTLRIKNKGQTVLMKADCTPIRDGVAKEGALSASEIAAIALKPDEAKLAQEKQDTLDHFDQLFK